jgi:hypothetical protein
VEAPPTLALPCTSSEQNPPEHNFPFQKSIFPLASKGLFHRLKLNIWVECLLFKLLRNLSGSDLRFFFSDFGIFAYIHKVPWKPDQRINKKYIYVYIHFMHIA